MARGGETAKVASHLWNRWRKTSLTERHNLAHQTGKIKVTRGDVVIVKTDDKNRGILLSSHASGETENCQIKFREICSAPLPAGTCKREHPSRNKAAEPRSSSFPVQKESCSRCQRADSKDCRPWTEATLGKYGQSVSNFININMQSYWFLYISLLHNMYISPSGELHGRVCRRDHGPTYNGIKGCKVICYYNYWKLWRKRIKLNH